MTIEEAKHLSEVLKAYSEGKTIQFKAFKDSVEPWKEINDYKIEELIHNKVQLRIKQEPKYRPYNDAQEFFKAQKEHGPYLQRINYSGFRIPQLVSNKGIRFSDVFEESPHYKDVLKLWKWQDGTPCGILE